MKRCWILKPSAGVRVSVFPFPRFDFGETIQGDGPADISFEGAVREVVYSFNGKGAVFAHCQTARLPPVPGAAAFCSSTLPGMSIREKVIGVISGMGPHAGLDLCTKIFDSTQARSDHEHLPVAMLSYPDRIVDRSTFLFEETDVNPAYAIADIARQLESVGATVAGMPCNTAHAPAIFDTVVEDLKRTGHSIELVNMIDATVAFMKEHMPHVGCVGTLSTLAVYELKLHRAPLEAAGFDVVVPDEDVKREVVNRTIFDTRFGLKAQTNPVTPKARENLLTAIRHLRGKGADAVVLGCTELPLAPLVEDMGDFLLVDPTEILARTLIEATYPETLRPLQEHYAAHAGP